MKPYDGPIRPEGVYVRYTDPQGHTRRMVRIPDPYPAAELAEPDPAAVPKWKPHEG